MKKITVMKTEAVKLTSAAAALYANGCTTLPPIIIFPER